MIFTRCDWLVYSVWPSQSAGCPAHWSRCLLFSRRLHGACWLDCLLDCLLPCLLACPVHCPVSSASCSPVRTATSSLCCALYEATHARRRPKAHIPHAKPLREMMSLQTGARPRREIIVRAHYLTIVHDVFGASKLLLTLNATSNVSSGN